MRASSVRGFVMLGGTLFLWVGSSIALQTIFGGDVQFRQPAFVTLFNSAMSSLLLLPRLCPRGRRRNAAAAGAFPKATRTSSMFAVAQLSSSVGLVWLLSQLLFNMSLLQTSVATNTVLSSTSSIFTLLFSLVIFGDSIRWLSFLAAFCTFLGCTAVTLQAPSPVGANAVPNSFMGDVLALVSAALFALTSVLLRRCSSLATAGNGGADGGGGGEDDIEPEAFLGMNGFISLCLAPFLLFAAHESGWESFRQPEPETLVFLAMNAFLGGMVANYLYTSALFLLSPLMASVTLSLSIPLAAFADEVLLGQHRFSFGWILGATLSASGVVFAALDMQPAESENGNKSARCEPSEADELQSLLRPMETDD